MPCANPRVLTLKYGAKEGENPPQAKAVQSALAVWAKSRGLKKFKVAVLDCIDGNGIDRLVQAWDIRQGSIGSNVTLTYSVVLPKAARSQSVDLTQRLGWLAEKALPWINQRLRELHREEVLEAAPGWSKPVWKHGGLGSQAERAPSRVGRCLLETAGRLTVSQGMRRQAFTALAAVEQKENFLEQGRLYPLVLEARALWETAHEKDTLPKSGFLLGVAGQMHTDYRRRAERKWNGFTWAGYPPAGWVRRLYTESRRLHR